MALRLHEDRNVLLVPTQAVQTGQRGDYVFVVKPEQRVAVRPVTTKRVNEETAVIASGLRAGETVVTDGQLQLSEGTQVQVRTDARRPVP